MENVKEEFKEAQAGLPISSIQGSKIRWQMCYKHTIPICRFCNFAYVLKTPLYKAHGRVELAQLVRNHMKKHPEYEVC